MAQFDYQPRYGPERYMFVLPAERDFNSTASTIWMQQNWQQSIVMSIAYVLACYVGQKLLQHRKPFDLQPWLTAWNAALAVFSIAGVIRMTPEFFWSISTQGFEYSMCTASFAQGITGFWTEMFAISKLVEFGDTAFIVLRKRPLIFLHWYHHITVLMYTWHAYKDHTASGRWFIWMNYTVHAFMYTYYALRAFNVRMPKRVPMCVTTLQITQMVVGIVIALNAYRIKASGGECQQTYENLYFSFTIYFTYFLLFCNFFYHAYLGKNNRYRGEKKQQPAVGDQQQQNGAVANGHAITAVDDGKAGKQLLTANGVANGHGDVSNGYNLRKRVPQ